MSPALARGCWPLLLAACAAAHAQLRLDITQGVRDAVPIAVVPFGGQAAGRGDRRGAVVASDLQHERPLRAARRARHGGAPDRGRRRSASRTGACSSPTSSSSGASSRSAPVGGQFELFNVLTGQPLLAQRLPRRERGPARHGAPHRRPRLREAHRHPGRVRHAHRLRLGRRRAAGQRYRLIVADADGETPRTVMRVDASRSCRRPGRRTASAWPMCRSRARPRRSTCSALATGERRRVSARAGINGAPAWSPDGKRLALTLSRDGNLDIYMLDLATQALTRLTRRRHRHRARVVAGRPAACTSRRTAPAARRSTRSPLGGRARPQRLTFERLQRAAAAVAGRQVAGRGDARPRRLPHRHAGPQDAATCAC